MPYSKTLNQNGSTQPVPNESTSGSWSSKTQRIPLTDSHSALSQLNSTPSLSVLRSLRQSAPQLSGEKPVPELLGSQLRASHPLPSLSSTSSLQSGTQSFPQPPSPTTQPLSPSTQHLPQPASQPASQPLLPQPMAQYVKSPCQPDQIKSPSSSTPQEDQDLFYSSSSSDRSPSPIPITTVPQLANPVDLKTTDSEDLLPIPPLSTDSLGSTNQLSNPVVIPFDAVKSSMTVRFLPFAPVVVKSKSLGLAFLSSVIPPKGFEKGESFNLLKKFFLCSNTFMLSRVLSVSKTRILVTAIRGFSHLKTSIVLPLD